MNLNKKVLMLVPFTGLLLTSCNKWANINKEKGFKVREELVAYVRSDDYKMPKRFISYYKNGTATITNPLTMETKEYKDVGNLMMYDYNQLFMQVKTVDDSTYRPLQYMVTKDNQLWHLWVEDEHKYKEELKPDEEKSQTIQDLFLENAKDFISSAMIGFYDYDPDYPGWDSLSLDVESVEGMKELAKEVKGIKASYQFSSDGKNSLKYVSNRKGEYETEEEGVAVHMKADSKIDVVVDNGMMQYTTINEDNTSKMGDYEFVEKNKYTKIFKYDRKVTIPEEAKNLDDWEVYSPEL